MKRKLGRTILCFTVLLASSAYAQDEAAVAVGSETETPPGFGINWNAVNLRGLGQTSSYTGIPYANPYVGVDGSGGDLPIRTVLTHPAMGEDPGMLVPDYLGGLGLKNRNSVNYDPYGLNLAGTFNPNFDFSNYTGSLRTNGIFWDVGTYQEPATNPNTSSDAQEFNDDGIFCAAENVPMVGAEVRAVGDATNVQSCFDMRIPASTKSNEESRLQSDINSCSCLKTLPLSSGIMNQSLAANTMIGTSELRNHIANQVQLIAQSELTQRMNGIYFTSALIFNESSLQNASQYGANVFNNETTVAENGRSLNLSYAPNLGSLINDEYPLPKGQCISKREYFQSRMIPEGRDMIYVRAVLDLGFRADKWDYKLVESRYRDLMKKSPRERAEYQTMHEIISLKARLKFLNRNPLLKYYFGSDNAPTTQKAQLFNNIQTALMNDGCMEITSACTEQFHGNLANFFSNPEARNIVRDGARADINKRILDQARRDFVTDSDDLYSRRAQPRNRNDLLERFRENFRLSSDATPDACHRSRLSTPMDGTKAEQCMQIFSAYCKTVDEYQDAVANSTSQFRGIPEEVAVDIDDDLDSQLANDYNTDLARNGDFAEFNERNCGMRSSGRGIFRDRVNFEEFTSDRCKDGDRAACSINSHADLVRLRQEFYASHPVARDGSVEIPATSLANGSMVREVGTSRYFSEERPSYDTFSGVADIDSGEVRRSVENVYSNAETVQRTQINNLRNESEAESGFNYSNYSNLNSGNSETNLNQVATTEPQRIQDMDQERRQELMEDWEQEYNIWKERYGSDKSPATVARDSELRTEISTLRALLDQQRSISDQQYQLLNDAIAARTRIEQENLQRDQERERSVASAERRSGGAGVVSRNSVEEEIARGPASIAEPQFNTSGVNGGGASSSSSSGASIGGNSSGNSAALGSSGSSDSVAREEAKLVNLRRFSDGSIVIESSSNGTGGAVNAINVPVSDEQYRILQTNPQGLNLSQIERSIPQEQISQLERNGEIILLLRNGQNPPFEVKVEKRDNRLVYSVSQNSGNQVPVRRVHLRSSLENLTKQFANPAN